MPPPPELNYEEQQSFSPPPPSNLHATVSNGAVQLDWQPPPPVTTPHAYSEKVIYYKVYRGTDPAHPDFIGRATGLTFTDRTPSPGVKYYYIVTAVHEGEIESSRGNAVSVTVGK
jgi:fibronectin type 3 domain-containing protein